MFGLDFIRKLRPCKWRYKGGMDDGVEHFGFVAQDVALVAPEGKYGFVRHTQDGLLFLEMAEFIGPMVKAIQELDERIATLEKELSS
jgi:hypothetical protein